MPVEYYIVVNGEQKGPFQKEDLRQYNITPETLVWRTGMSEWTKAALIPELADIFTVDVEINSPEPQENVIPDNGWYAMLAGNRVGPATVAELISRGLRPDTPVWHNGMSGWMPASSRTEIMQALNNTRPPYFDSYGSPDFRNNPQYGQPPFGSRQSFGDGQQYPNFSDNRQYDNKPPYGNSPARTNWMPWAIAATIVGFLFSCIGAIFGIIAIVQANKANEMYAAGYREQGDASNNTAKIMTIIGLVLAGVGLVSSTFLLRNNNFLNMLNYL